MYSFNSLLKTESRRLTYWVKIYAVCFHLDILRIKAQNAHNFATTNYELASKLLLLVTKHPDLQVTEVKNKLTIQNV